MERSSHETREFHGHAWSYAMLLCYTAVTTFVIAARMIVHGICSYGLLPRTGTPYNELKTSPHEPCDEPKA